MNNLLGILIGILYIGIIIFTGKLFEKKGKEVSRKFIHIMLSFYWVISIIYFDNVIAATVLPIAFVIINAVSYKFNLIKQMERTDKKDGYGTIYYAISLLILAILTYGPLKYYKGIYGPYFALVGVLSMGLGDGFAAIVGKKVKSLEYKVGNTKKTIAGSLTMFVMAFLISSIFLFIVKSNYWTAKSIIIGILAMIIEAVSIKGLDNITVPILVTLFSIILV